MINSQTHPSPYFITWQNSLRTDRWQPGKVMVWVGVEDRKMSLLKYVMFLPSSSQGSGAFRSGDESEQIKSCPNLERMNMCKTRTCDVIVLCHVCVTTQTRILSNLSHLHRRRINLCQRSISRWDSCLCAAAGSPEHAWEVMMTAG